MMTSSLWRHQPIFWKMTFRLFKFCFLIPIIFLIRFLTLNHKMPKPKYVYVTKTFYDVIYVKDWPGKCSGFGKSLREPQNWETSATSAASNFQELFVMQFDAKCYRFEEKSVHGTIIWATLSFLYCLFISYSSILPTVLSCGAMSTSSTFRQHI